MSARLNVRCGSMERAVGAEAAAEALRGVLSQADVEVVATGSDGASWAAPSAGVPPSGKAPLRAAAASAEGAAALLDGGGDAALGAYLNAQTRRVTSRCGHIDPTSLEEARAAGAYVGLKQAVSMSPAEVVGVVEASGLRGRGGAYFPVHLKWRSAVEASARNGEPILVVNGEEGEPGVFKDRLLMEGDPHRLLEGILIAAYAVGAGSVYVYINGQAGLSAERVQQAIRRAEAAGFLGGQGGEARPRVEVRRGAGGYVCGEETVILESIEGGRAVPRLRPPFPTERGLWGRPTVINNVETLCNLPEILRFGASWFREVGTEEAPGTKLISLSGAVERPGLIEVSMGTPVGEILAIGGGAGAQGVVAGGPSGGLLPARKFGAAIGPGMLDAAGAVLGSGGMVAFAARFPAAEVLQVEAAYNARESCGKCTPCREGSGRLVEALERLRAGDATARRDIDELVEVMRVASLCGLGQMAPNPVTSALADFSDAIGAGG